MRFGQQKAITDHALDVRRHHSQERKQDDGGRVEKRHMVDGDLIADLDGLASGQDRHDPRKPKTDPDVDDLGPDAVSNCHLAKTTLGHSHRLDRVWDLSSERNLGVDCGCGVVVVCSCSL